MEDIDGSTEELSNARCYCCRGYRSRGGRAYPLDSLRYKMIRNKVSHIFHLFSSLDWVRVGWIPISCGRYLSVHQLEIDVRKSVGPQLYPSFLHGDSGGKEMAHLLTACEGERPAEE